MALIMFNLFQHPKLAEHTLKEKIFFVIGAVSGTSAYAIVWSVQVVFGSGTLMLQALLFGVVAGGIISFIQNAGRRWRAEQTVKALPVVVLTAGLLMGLAGILAASCIGEARTVTAQVQYSRPWSEPTRDYKPWSVGIHSPALGAARLAVASEQAMRIRPGERLKLTVCTNVLGSQVITAMYFGANDELVR